MFAFNTPDPSFFTELIGMPDADALRSAELQTDFLARITALYGSEDAAAAALHAYVDCGDLAPDDLPWDAAHAQVVAAMGLPAGARFECYVDGCPCKPAATAPAVVWPEPEQPAPF